MTTTKIDIDQIVQILTDDIANSSTVSGVTVSDALENISASIGDAFDFTDTVDPAPTTNPASVGAVWKNTTTGEIFVCIDNTTDKNIWIGTSETEIGVNTQAQGNNYGYTSGGFNSSGNRINNIDKFSFTSVANATDVGDLTNQRGGGAGASSVDHGYTIAGSTSGGGVNTIDRFAFASDANAVDVGDTDATHPDNPSGHESTTHGYISGLRRVNSIVAEIQKFAFASSSNASVIGSTTVGRSRSGHGSSSFTHGYTSGGITAGGASNAVNVIDRFSFATDGNSTDVGDLTAQKYQTSGFNSRDNGFTTGGVNSSGTTIDTIDKFAFASSANATAVATLSQAVRFAAGQSAYNHGYTSGGIDSGSSVINVIEEFSFVSEATSVDVADLTLTRRECMGQQY